LQTIPESYHIFIDVLLLVIFRRSFNFDLEASLQARTPYMLFRVENLVVIWDAIGEGPVDEGDVELLDYYSK
jgi:hypothetical protein